MTDMPVDVVRSPRRRKTVAGRVIAGRIEVRVPAGLSLEKDERLVSEMVEKLRRRATSTEVDLSRRATELARLFHLSQPEEITWSSRQNTRWGSCTPADRRIRISDRLASMPAWVLDSVIVHELAHLEVADHGPAFEELVRRYPLTERARGYLIAAGEGRLQPVLD